MTGLFAELRVPGTSYPLGAVLDAHTDVSVDVERIVPTGGSTHYAWIGGAERDAVVDRLRDREAVRDLAVVDELPDRALVRFEWPSGESPVFHLLAEAEATVSGMSWTRDGWLLRTRFDDQDALAEFYEACRSRGVPIDLRRILEADGVEANDEYGLTETQYETLLAAFDAGYFDIPRGITLSGLADELGISEQAVSERLRRGLSSLLRSNVPLDAGGDGAETERTD